MSNKYECRFFPNGRVVFIPIEDIENAIHARKELLVVCNSWSGGYAIAIGAEEDKDPYDGTPCWSMYSYSVKDEEFPPEKMQEFYKIIFSSGERIMMETGDEAISFSGGWFFDWNTKKPHNVSDKDWEEKRNTVNAQFTINMLRDDEKAECLSNYAVKINWDGTKFGKNLYKII